MAHSEKHIPAQREGLTPRSYPSAMLLPFFPEADGIREFSTTLDDVEVKVYVEGDQSTLVNSGDRKVIGVLSAALARQIRAGIISRHIEIQVPELMRMLDGDRKIGGEDYTRLREKLERLMATVVETSEPAPDGLRRNRRFRWVDGFVYDSTDTSITGHTKSIRISLSEESFSMMAGGLGYDTPPDAYRSVISNPSSTWRVYEICLAKVLRNNSKPTSIPISELHQRIPLKCEVRVFKARALKRAIKAIAEHPQMSKHIGISLQRKCEDGFEEVDFSQRSKVDDLVIWIEPKDLSDIKPERLLELDDKPVIQEACKM